MPVKPISLSRAYIVKRYKCCLPLDGLGPAYRYSPYPIPCLAFPRPETILPPGTNLQDCVKAQQNAAYANKVKLSNLKEMAKTVAYIQERGYDTRDSLEDSFSEVKNLASSSRKVLKDTEDKLRILNEQIHYTGQYLANKSVYRQFCRAKHKGQFREEHPAEIALYESARKFLQGQSADGRLPSIKLLKAEKEQLLHKKKEAQKTYHYYRDYQKELNTVCSNVDKILGQARTRQPEKQKGADIS